MSLSPAVPLLLAACWVLPAFIIAILYRVGAGAGSAEQVKEMNTSYKGIRADILQVDYDPQAEGWREENWEGPGARVRAQVEDVSHEVMVIAPYAEASVTVAIGKKRSERRRCSLCLN